LKYQRKHIRSWNQSLRHWRRLELQEFGKISRRAFRRAKTDSLKKDAFNIIDGDFIEYFLMLD